MVKTQQAGKVSRRMMYVYTVSSKGQLTLPKALREKLGIHRGVGIEIRLLADGFIAQVLNKSYSELGSFTHGVRENVKAA